MRKEVAFKNRDRFIQLGISIASLRKLRGMSQEALAEKAEVTTQFVSYAESGKRAMRPENLLKISEALGVSADYLLTGDMIDKDSLLLSEKLRMLTPKQLTLIDGLLDTYIAFCNETAADD